MRSRISLRAIVICLCRISTLKLFCFFRLFLFPPIIKDGLALQIYHTPSTLKNGRRSVNRYSITYSFSLKLSAIDQACALPPFMRNTLRYFLDSSSVLQSRMNLRLGW